MTIVSENEKIFEHYVKLPEKARMVVINKMQPDDRCRFTRCSKNCSKEAKMSKNFIYELKLKASIFDITTKIEVTYNKYHESNKDQRQGYILEFKRTENVVRLRYFNREMVELWSTDLDSSIDIAQYDIRHFKKLLQCYQNKIKQLELIEICRSDDLKNFDFEIESFTNLEELRILGGFDILQFLSKLHFPLKKLSIYDIFNQDMFSECEAIYKVQNELSLISTHLTSAQFSKLSAKNVDIPLGNLTEKDIFDFICSWQNGTIGREIGIYIWWFPIKESSFSIERLLNLLKLQPSLKDVIINHHKQAGETASFHILPSALIFSA